MGEHRRRGSIVDLLLILLCFLFVLGVIWRYRTRGERTDVTRELLLYAVVQEVRPSVADTLSAGDALYNAAGEYCGTLVSVRREPSRVVVLTEGAYVEGAWEMGERVDLHLELSVAAIPTANGILLHGVRIAIGSPLPALYTERSVLRCVLYNMTPIETQ